MGGGDRDQAAGHPERSAAEGGAESRDAVPAAERSRRTTAPPTPTATRDRSPERRRPPALRARAAASPLRLRRAGYPLDGLLQTQLVLLGPHSLMDEASAQYMPLDSQHPGVGAQGEPAAGAHTDMFVHTQAPPVHACCGLDAARHEAPDSQQSGFAVVQDAPVAVHWSSSHCLDVALHVSPVQHAVAVQSAARPPHCGAGGAQTPSAQTSPGALQQSESSVHSLAGLRARRTGDRRLAETARRSWGDVAREAGAAVGVDGAGRRRRAGTCRPTGRRPDRRWRRSSTGRCSCSRRPRSRTDRCCPGRRCRGRPRSPAAWQVVPSQQFELDGLQTVPRGSQDVVGVAHRSTPSASGTHGVPPQH